MFKTDSPADVSKLAQIHQAGRLRGRAMQAALSALLNKVEGARAALPHLWALEAALGRQGTAAIDEVPAHWLPRIIKQLSSLPMGDEDHELQNLLSRLCRALARHQQLASAGAAGPAAPGPCLNQGSKSMEGKDSKDSDSAAKLKDCPQDSLDVQELGHSAFLEEFATIAAAASPATEPVVTVRADQPAQPAQSSAAAEPGAFSLQPR